MALHCIVCLKGSLCYWAIVDSRLIRVYVKFLIEELLICVFINVSDEFEYNVQEAAAELEDYLFHCMYISPPM